MKNHSSQDTTLDISIIGLMSALVFVGTYFFKIPSAFGYTHLGDCMIILTVCLFGTRRGILAGAIGAGLSDFLGGYAVWVLPTMVLKGLWAFIAGTIAYKLRRTLNIPGLSVLSSAASPYYRLHTRKDPALRHRCCLRRNVHPVHADHRRNRPRRRGLHDPCTVPGDPNIKGKICVNFRPVLLKK